MLLVCVYCSSCACRLGLFWLFGICGVLLFSGGVLMLLYFCGFIDATVGYVVCFCFAGLLCFDCFWCCVTRLSL